MKVKDMIASLEKLLDESKKYGVEDPEIFFISKDKKIYPMNLISFTCITNEEDNIDESFIYVTDNDDVDYDVYHEMLEETFPEQFPKDNSLTTDMYLPSEEYEEEEDE